MSSSTQVHFKNEYIFIYQFKHRIKIGHINCMDLTLVIVTQKPKRALAYNLCNLTCTKGFYTGRPNIQAVWDLFI